MSNTPKKNGRPSKLTPEIKNKILSRIRAGNYIEVVCSNLLSKQTFYNWKNQAEEDKAAGKVTEFTRFLDELTCAEADGEAELVEKVRGSDDWKAAAWILARRHNARWGKQDEAPAVAAKATQEADGGLTVQIVYGAGPDETSGEER